MTNDFSQWLKDDLKKADIVADYEIEIGVVSKDTGRKEVVKVGITNAELMFIHENGSPLRSIPARPVLQMTLEYTQQNLLDKTLDKIYDGMFYKDWVGADVEKELNKMCMKMENYARDIIYSNDGRLIPNAPSVAKAKKGNHPLFDTGQLARSITCRVVKK